MTANDRPIGDADMAEKRARAWLRAQIKLEYVERPPAAAMYGLNPQEEWVFRVSDLRFVGTWRFLAVNRVTGRVTEFEAGE